METPWEKGVAQIYLILTQLRISWEYTKQLKTLLRSREFKSKNPPSYNVCGTEK